MERKMKRAWQRKTAAVAAAMLTMSFGSITHAMPQGDIVRSGEATIQRSDDNKSMEINQSTKRVAIDWKNFDIANDERVNFRQPDARSIALNRVTGDAKSVIDGQLTGNGQVFVVNPNGVLFGRNASVDVGSLVASTAKVSDAAMTGFGTSTGDVSLAVDDANTSASIINEGRIKAEGGLVALHAASVANNGTITNEGGRIALAAAKTITLSADTAGKINFDVDGKLAKASTLNTGVLKADGGYVVMTAKQAGDVMSTVVNNTGTIEARTLRRDEKGDILLDGGNAGIISINGLLDASGVEAGQSAGSIKAIGAETHIGDGAALLARGQVNGGLIETSGDYLEIGDAANMDASGKLGKAGEWLLDPLNVIISEKADGADVGANGSHQEIQNEDANRTSWVNSKTINRLLSNGTSVTIQSVDKNKAATIAVDADIEKAGTEDTTFTLQAQSNITVNKSITSSVGKLNVVLNSDIDGNGIGAVIINADIDTNGGNFIAGSGGNVELTDGKVTGFADPTKGTVGTYFGNGKTTGDRTINTNGGAVNLYGDVAIALNGGNLVLNPGVGAVTVTGNIDSGHSYTLHTIDDADWDGLVNKIKKQYSDKEWDDQLRSYYNSLLVQNKTAQSGQRVYVHVPYWKLEGEAWLRLSWYYAKGLGYTREQFETLWKNKLRYGDSEWNAKLMKYYNAKDEKTGEPILSEEDKIFQTGEKALNTRPVTYDKLDDTAKALLSKYYVANNWNFAKILAQGDTDGGANVKDTYLATITTALENSLVSQGKENPLFVGGRGSANAQNPVDSTYRDGYYWVTGPEGTANGGTGTKFANNDGTPTENAYVKWNTSKSSITGATQKEPNNSGPYVSVGFGLASNWDDVSQEAGTTRGFVQEMNLEHSGLVINSNGGYVKLGGNVGRSSALNSLEIKHAGTVDIGGGTNQAEAVLSGIVHVDNNVDVTGKNVVIGDRITADNGHVNIASDGNIMVHGITAKKQISLVSTGEAGKIILDKYGVTNDGSLITRSGENDAVIIDARGTKGAFRNLTTAEKAIKTGKGGNWKVYSYSPDADEFGKNLNSETTARWHAGSQGGNGLDKYAATEDMNKYIFQVQPTVYVKADDMTKVYGEEITNANITTTARAMFSGQDKQEHDVNAYTSAFNEGNVSDYYNGSDGRATFESAGWTKTATRTNGDSKAADGNKAVYDVKVTSESYELTEKGKKNGYADATAKDGTVEILRRRINISGSGSQTYGNAAIHDWEVTASLTGDQQGVTGSALVDKDRLNNRADILSIKSGSEYATKQKGRTTADVQDARYTDAVNMENVNLLDGADANYEIVNGQGILKVNKAKLNIHTDDINTTYGMVKMATTTVDGLTNGDLVSGFTFDYGDYGGAYLDNNTRTNAVGRYTFKASYADPAFLKNYDVTSNDATVTITMPQQKPDIDHNTTTNLNGSGSYTNNLGNHGIPGVERIAGLASTELPFFKVEHGRVHSYGTYSVATDPNKVTLEATGKRLPEPNQPKTQYREYTKELTTSAGTGTFRMVYDGSTFRIKPVDMMAKNVIASGDATQNVELYAQALHVGFNEMGILLEDLDGVYVHFDENE